ncbi:MAG TPA: uroporphyrinogen decarboxylase family protein [Anaerolineaceae bacterium]|nr:uroporphyrinogen decarboxylase family protein [Anaerolineaceae bacterium]
MNKRELVMQVLEENKPQAYIPAGFFIHFDPKYHHGQAAIDKHLEYFHYTGMDFVKIQYEKVFPFRKEILNPEDWVNMPKYGIEFYQEQVEVARGLVKAAGKDALVIMTLYSPFMCARDTVGGVMLVKQIRENPEAVKKGMEIITESLRIFVRACIEAGVDGFYHSTQGGETNRFEGSPLFDECIKPFDLSLMNEINEKCHFNILHICDYIASYSDLTPFLEYPGHVVNSSLTLGKRTITAQQVVDLFQRPFMGGVERLGTIANGTPAEIETMIRQVLKNAPHRYILGADCTLPSTVDWDNIRLAISLAHSESGAL